MLGHAIPTPRPLLPFTLDSTLGDLQTSAAGRKVVAFVHSQVAKAFGLGDADPDGDLADNAQAGMFSAMLKELPVRGLAMMSDGKVSLRSAANLVRILNATTPKAWRKGGAPHQDQ